MTKTKSNAAMTAAPLETPAAPVEVANPGIAPAAAAPAGNMLSGAASAINAKLAAKADLLAIAKQKLAHAADLFSDGRAKNSEASDIANSGAIPLYDGAVSGYFSPAEVSAALGDIFGYKPKADGTPGKTPAGEGEAIRKRIVRAVSAYHYVTGTDGGKFFAGLPVEEIAPVCEAIGNGSLSLFTAYERFADIRKEHTAKADQAFSVKHVEGLCESLAKPEALAIIRGNPELQKAYGLMLALLTAIDTAPAETE